MIVRYHRLTSRNCLRDPIPEIFDAARFLDAAVSAHLRAENKTAEDLIRLADMPAIKEWTESLWGKGGPSSRRLVVQNVATPIAIDKRSATRMPNEAEKRDLRQRDGFHCRFCGIPLIRREVRSQMQSQFPTALRWGDRNIEQHAAFQAMWLQYDHLVPHAMGGTNEMSNMLITCAPCNFGRAECSLEEVGLADPRLRQFTKSTWDGLERFRK